VSEAGRQHVLTRLFQRLYGEPTVRNDLRGELVEEIVALALEPDWQLCGGDWAACDLLHVASGARMQVKQSAARQSWTKDGDPAPSPRFSIAETAGRWDGSRWVPGVGRNAEFYVFAWHPVSDEHCDHADVSQWAFYVVEEQALPKQKSLGLAQVAKLASAVPWTSLGAQVSSLLEAKVHNSAGEPL
jgi:hypothetical protein